MGRFFKERPRYGDERSAPADRADLFGSDEKANPFEKAEPKDCTATTNEKTTTMLFLSISGSWR